MAKFLAKKFSLVSAGFLLAQQLTFGGYYE